MKPGTRFKPKSGFPSFQTPTDPEVGQVVGVETTAIDPGKHLKPCLTCGAGTSPRTRMLIEFPAEKISYF